MFTAFRESFELDIVVKMPAGAATVACKDALDELETGGSSTPEI